MAVSFVPVPIPVDWTGKCRSWSSRGSPSSCVPSPSESMSWMRGAGPWDPTQDETWSRPRVLDGTLTLLKGEGGCWDSWMERAITPTLLGYEILDERAKFTVYKILVTGDGGDSWVIFRRFRDFCRLNDQLKELFPSLGLTLPPKRWFKDNYDEEFLHKRQIGLQTFLQNLTLNRDFSSSEAVRHFLCLVDPPSPFDSLEESRASCETLEETNHRLQRELLENQREVDILKKNLEEKENYISLLVKKVKLLTLSSESIESSASVATNSNKHRAGGTEVNGFEQHQTDRNDGMDDRGYATLEINIQSACGARFCSEESEDRKGQAQRRYNHGE